MPSSKTRKKRVVERWLPLPLYVGLYDISDNGRIRGYRQIGGHPLKKPRLIKPFIREKGYKGVTLYKKNTSAKFALVHSLVLATFLGKRPRGLQCAHLNGNPRDNRLANLAYVSPKVNVSHRRKHGTMLYGMNNHKCKTTKRDVLNIRKALKSRKMPWSELSNKFNISIATLSNISRGKHWTDRTPIIK
mgnify:CR=1 FL=1